MSRVNFVLHRHDYSSDLPAIFESGGVFACIRAVEVLAPQASPILGLTLSNYSLETSGLIRPVLVLGTGQMISVPCCNLPAATRAVRLVSVLSINAS